MILLPNSCRCSKLSVHPKNWKTKKASLKVDWYITYRFYDPEFLDKYKKGKQVFIREFKHFEVLEERQAMVQHLLDNEKEQLTLYAYNPITGTRIIPEDVAYVVDPATPFILALKATVKLLSVAPSTLAEIEMVIRNIEKPAKQLRIDTVPISKISRKHIRGILDLSTKVDGQLSAHKFNKYRSSLMILFNELNEIEATEIDPVSKIKKKKAVKTLRDTLTLEQREKINTELKPKHYTFWRLIQIFFESGSRASEILRLRANHIDLKNQRFKVLIQKGKAYREEWKTINNNSLYLWEEIMAGAKPEDYIFSRNLCPGPAPIRREQIIRRWKHHVKLPFGVTADFYALKHLKTTAVIKALAKREKAIEVAASHNNHTIAMVKNIYDVEAEQEKHEILKNVNTQF